jgi:hypothetical protein
VSADNWTTCPRCADRAQKEWDERVRAHVASYGVINANEYIEEDANIARGKPLDPETFREDYDFFFETVADEGVTVVATYSGSCRECGLGLKFQDRHLLYVNGDTRN